MPDKLAEFIQDMRDEAAAERICDAYSESVVRNLEAAGDMLELSGEWFNYDSMPPQYIAELNRLAAAALEPVTGPLAPEQKR